MPISQAVYDFLVQFAFLGVWAHGHGVLVYAVFLVGGLWSAWRLALRQTDAPALRAALAHSHAGTAACVASCLIGAVLLAVAQVLPSVVQAADARSAAQALFTSGVLPLGGLIGFTVALWVMVENHAKQGSWRDASVPFWLAWLAACSFGAYLAGLDVLRYGRSSSLPWGVNFGDGIYRHPTQLYELFWLGGIAWLLRQPTIKTLFVAPGDRFGLMLLGVLAGQLFLGYLMPPFERPRLLTEILRGEPMRWFGVLTAAQAIALLMLLTLLPMWWRWVTRTPSQSTQQTTER